MRRSGEESKAWIRNIVWNGKRDTIILENLQLFGKKKSVEATTVFIKQLKATTTNDLCVAAVSAGGARGATNVLQAAFSVCREKFHLIKPKVRCAPAAAAARSAPGGRRPAGGGGACERESRF
ncbi:hypothetical protein EVAR_63969_1 [Eumeta japonica]|uniref:Uncharacterized protein n=1 Tax=Eumeta variegata TaxID=151549 RepID=A0A4C1ZGC2_EUMVA|nr:hypothetical protein EVAR_63969_1 [Eumeta japonica]